MALRFLVGLAVVAVVLVMAATDVIARSAQKEN